MISQPLPRGPGPKNGEQHLAFLLMTVYNLKDQLKERSNTTYIPPTAYGLGIIFLLVNCVIPEYEDRPELGSPEMKLFSFFNTIHSKGSIRENIHM